MQAHTASDSPRRGRRGRGAYLPDRLGKCLPGLSADRPPPPDSTNSTDTVIPQLNLRVDSGRCLALPPSKAAALLFPHARFIALGNRWKNRIQIHGKKKIQARTADFAVRVFSVAIIATVPYSIVRQPTDRNSGVLFFPIDISLSSCACSGGERNSPSLISPCWREPSTERGHCTLFT